LQTFHQLTGISDGWFFHQSNNHYYFINYSSLKVPKSTKIYIKFLGYGAAKTGGYLARANFRITPVYLLQLAGDLIDLVHVFNRTSKVGTTQPGHCSALVKVTPGNGDLSVKMGDGFVFMVASNSWQAGLPQHHVRLPHHEPGAQALQICIW